MVASILGSQEALLFPFSACLDHSNIALTRSSPAIWNTYDRLFNILIHKHGKRGIRLRGGTVVSLTARRCCVEFACSPRACVGFSWYSGLLPQSNDVSVKLVHCLACEQFAATLIHLPSELDHTMTLKILPFLPYNKWTDAKMFSKCITYKCKVTRPHAKMFACFAPYKKVVLWDN